MTCWDYSLGHPIVTSHSSWPNRAPDPHSPQGLPWSPWLCSLPSGSGQHLRARGLSPPVFPPAHPLARLPALASAPCPGLTSHHHPCSRATGATAVWLRGHSSAPQWSPRFHWCSLSWPPPGATCTGPGTESESADSCGGGRWGGALRLGASRDRPGRALCGLSRGSTRTQWGCECAASLGAGAIEHFGGSFSSRWKEWLCE